MPSPTLHALSNRLIDIGQSILDTPAGDIPAIAALMQQRETLVQQIGGGIEADPGAATAPLLANLCTAEAAGRRIAEQLNLARAGLCEQLQSLYQDNFRLRAWLAGAVNQPQECDCRG